ncbi:Ig-like domain-containing protein [Desulfoplanes formicivorans]|uniref:HYDIN/VesB/CFA65-like Ig-like domain-containing protein n=1 Tax=Desulfoplanes formicivorans TaxID=1592317 RepID=A0A194ALG5_9BACT|nr:DUF1573 domain-containing protein [Desulfoplanes formicivorans]GAU09509.1 hypothetical protein DPF_2236 [Desulfoplanes formicivorans]
MVKKIFALAMLFCSLTLPAFAGGLGFSTKTIDFGTLREGPTAQKKVILSNIGSEPVTITNVTTS